MEENEFISTVRKTLETSRELRNNVARVREELRQTRLERELARLTADLEKAERELAALTEIETAPATEWEPPKNRWLERGE